MKIINADEASPSLSVLPRQPLIGDSLAGLDDSAVVDDDWVGHRVEHLVQRRKLVPIDDDERTVRVRQYLVYRGRILNNSGRSNQRI